MNTRIGILGIGAIGGMLAAIFEKNKLDVTCIVKTEHINQLTKIGIILHSQTFGNLVAHPHITDTLTSPVDILFIAVKASDLKQALTKIPPKYTQGAIIIPLLNGIGHISLLRHMFDQGLCMATIGNVEVYRNDIGEVIHANHKVRIEMGSDSPEMSQKLIDIRELLLSCGIEAEIQSSEAQTIWNKLVRLCAIAATTAASQKPIGEIRKDPEWRLLLEVSVQEISLIAQAEGASIDANKVMSFIDTLPETQFTSLARDIAKHKRGETDAIISSVIQCGTTHGIDCKNLKVLLKRIEARLS